MSISDLDIYRTANELIRHHAADARLQAAQFADLCATRHDRAGFNVWVRVIAAIQQLQEVNVPNGTVQH
ncbi:MAG TPA: hypothetical protein VGO34_10750 [Alphaproteobacteria bacterium]|jgi:hypothetical protein